MSSRFLDTQFHSPANSTKSSCLQLFGPCNHGRQNQVFNCYLYNANRRLLLFTTGSVVLKKLSEQQWRRQMRPRPLLVAEASALDVNLKAAPMSLPDGPWVQIPGGISAPSGFQAAGIYAGLRAAGKKPDLALVTCEVDAVSAGAFTKNVMAAAPVIYCKKIMANSPTARAVLINAGQANAATGDAGYQDALDCAEAVAKLMDVKPTDVLLLSTGVIGHRIKKDALFKALPRLKSSVSCSVSSSYAAAVAITTTDLVTKSIAIETQVGGRAVKLAGMAKGSGMIHPNMATMLSVVTCDAPIKGSVWRDMLLTAVNRSFNQVTVDGDTSTNDTVIALSSGLCGGSIITDTASAEAQELQKALDVVLQALAKSVAWDGEGATCLVEVLVTGAETEAAAATVARSVAASSLTKSAIFGGDPNWGRIACAAGYAGVNFDPNNLDIKLGSISLMKDGQPLPFDRDEAQKYLKSVSKCHGTVQITISIGNGPGKCQAWGCDLTYDYIRINAEYTS